MKNSMKKFLILAILFSFFFSSNAEAASLNFRRDVLKRQKANVVSTEKSAACDQLLKVKDNLAKKVESVSSTSGESLTNRTSELQEAWAKQDEDLYERRREVKERVETKFLTLGEKIPEDKSDDLDLFKKRVFDAIEKRNIEIDAINEEYRNSIFAYLSEYNGKKEVSLSDFEKNIQSKVYEIEEACKETGNLDKEKLEIAMRDGRNTIKNSLAGEHFRDFAETKREERNKKILETREAFDLQIKEAREDFTDF